MQHKAIAALQCRHDPDVWVPARASHACCRDGHYIHALRACVFHRDGRCRCASPKLVLMFSVSTHAVRSPQFRHCLLAVARQFVSALPYQITAYNAISSQLSAVNPDEVWSQAQHWRSQAPQPPGCPMSWERDVRKLHGRSWARPQASSLSSRSAPLLCAWLQGADLILMRHRSESSPCFGSAGNINPCSH